MPAFAHSPSPSVAGATRADARVHSTPARRACVRRVPTPQGCEAGRASMRAGQGRPNDDVEAKFAARRANMASWS